MKKILIMLLVLLPLLLLGEINNTTGGRLPRDSNGSAIQLGKNIRLYDDDIAALEHLDENTFATHVNWDMTNDIVDSGGNLTWTWADGDASTATQVNADMVLATRNLQAMRLTYTVSIDTALAGGSVAAWISGICDSTALDITVGTSKTLSITTGAAASAADFVINIDPDGDVSAGVVSIDNVYLTSYYESPISILTGASATITVPDNAVSLYIDPATADVKITIGTSYFITSTAMTIPVLGHDTITITDVAGGSVVSFYFSML